MSDSISDIHFDIVLFIVLWKTCVISPFLLYFSWSLQQMIMKWKAKWIILIYSDYSLEWTKHLYQYRLLFLEEILLEKKKLSSFFLSQTFDKCFLGSSETADANRVFCGQMTAVYLFNEALNAAQIFAIYQLGLGYKVLIYLLFIA